MAAALEARGLVVERAGRRLLDVPHLTIADGEVLAALGPNGAGKSTLLRCLALLERPTAGSVRFRDQEIRWRDAIGYRRRTALLFQEPLLLDTTVYENVALGLRLRGVRTPELRRRVAAWLDRLSIGPLAGRAARTLSSGEARRVSLARAFVTEPEVLFLDEPFNALDAPSRAAFMHDLVALLAERRTTTVLVTHDRSEVEALADRVAVLLDGAIAEIGAVETTLAEPREPRVAAFLRSGALPRRRTAQPSGGETPPYAMVDASAHEERPCPGH